MANDAFFAVNGYVATQPKVGMTRDGQCSVSMRVAWTPRAISKATGEWTDQQTSFVSVICYRKVAENAAICLRRGDPVVLRGTLRVREYDDQAGVRRNSVDVVAVSLGHDMSRGVSHYSKTPQHSEQTAEEYKLSTSGERTPLPGDLAAGPASEYRSDVPQPSDWVRPGDPERAADHPAGSTYERPARARVRAAARADYPEQEADPGDPVADEAVQDEAEPDEPDEEQDLADLAGRQSEAELARASA